MADYDTEVCLFFTLPDGMLDCAEMDQAKGLADVLLAVPVTEVTLFDTLTDMITKHDAMARTTVKLQQYTNDCLSLFRLCPGMKQEAYMVQTQGLMAMSTQHMPMPMYLRWFCVNVRCPRRSCTPAGPATVACCAVCPAADAAGAHGAAGA